MTNDNIFSQINNKVAYFKNIDNEKFVGEVTMIDDSQRQRTKGNIIIGSPKTIRKRITFHPGVSTNTLDPGYAYAFALELAMKIAQKKIKRGEKCNPGSVPFNMILSQILCVPYRETPEGVDALEEFEFKEDSIIGGNSFQAPVSKQKELDLYPEENDLEQINIDKIDSYSDIQLANFYGDQEYIKKVKDTGSLHHTQRSKIIEELRNEALNGD